MSIRIFYDDVSFRYRGWRKLKKTLERIIGKYGNNPGDISIIISSDQSLLRINKEFLEHDYYTDVITFDYNDGNIVNGEVYISIDTVRRNSVNYNVSLIKEVSRVIIHGVLHLNGFDDKNEEQRIIMRAGEDFWLARMGEE